MISTTEHIQRAIANNRNLKDAVRNIPNDQELGGYVREIYKNDMQREKLDRQQLSMDFTSNNDDENETFLTQHKYYKNRNWLGR